VTAFGVLPTLECPTTPSSERRFLADLRLTAVGGTRPVAEVARLAGDADPRPVSSGRAALSAGKLCKPHLHGTYISLKTIARFE
jgi:hypothetical protein